MVDEIGAIIEEYRKEHVLSGNILITRSGAELLSQSYGQASIQLDAPNHIHTKFHIASVTKMFIATAALSLQEKGLIGLDDHPGKYKQLFKALHPDMKIHHLLNHSSGLQDIYTVPNVRFEMSRLIAEQQDFVNYLVRLPQDFTPGERWRYNSTGFIIMGYILEEATGLSYDQVMEKLFFSPLQLNETGVDNPRNVNHGRAMGHTLVNDKWINAENDKLSEVQAPGELYSTVHDLNTWCDALFGGRLLSEDQLKKMFTPYYATSFDQDLKYGYGWFLGSDFYLIGGGTPGFRSEIWHFPHNDLSVIMLWNYEKVDSHDLFRKLRPALLKE